MFSSNNTTEDIFKMAVADGGCILNIDDITMIEKVEEFPEFDLFPLQSRRKTHRQ